MEPMEGRAEQVLTAALDNEAIVAYMRHDVVVLAALLRDGMASRALLDALDAVPRRTTEHADYVYDDDFGGEPTREDVRDLVERARRATKRQSDRADRAKQAWEDAEDRAERAEREREELRACVRRVEAERDSQAEKRQRAEREFGRLHSTYLEIAEALRVNHDRTDRLREALQVATDSLSYVLLRCRQMGLDVGRDVSGESWLMPFANGMQPEYDILRRTRAALSADADADAEPEPRAHESWESDGWWAQCVDCGHGWPDAEPFRAELRDRAERDEAAWESQNPPPPRGADTEPGGFHHDFGCTHDPCECSGEPSRAEGDEQPKSLNDLAREWGLPPLTWVHMGFIEPHEPSPDVDGAYMNHEMGRLEAPCLNCRNKPNCRNKIVVAIPHHAEGGRPREADPQGAPSGNGDASVDGGGDECDCDTAQYDGEHSRYCPAGDGGRSPAINAVFEATSLRLEQCVDAIDTALASGHVRLTDPGEPDISVEAYWAVSEERDRAEARVREVERECRMLAQRLLAKDETLTREERERLSGMAGRNDWSRS